jgi:predicted nucleic acid-binding protein
MNFADTNWLEALYFESHDPAQKKREQTAERFMRTHGGRLAVSQIVFLEARNVFSRSAKESEPEEWKRLAADLKSGLIYLDPMNWDLVRRTSFELFARHSHRVRFGTLDAAILASAKVLGATRLLSFDEALKRVAVAERLDVFPPLPKGTPIIP